MLEIIINRNLTNNFIKKLNELNDVAKVEKEILGITTSKITAEIFKHWKLSDNLVKMIEFVDDIENCEEEYKQKAQILDVIKSICNVCDPFSEKSIMEGLEKARRYELNLEDLENAISVLKSRYI